MAQGKPSFMSDESASTENVFNMGLESLKTLRKEMNEYYFWSKNDEPIRARGCLEAMYAEAYPDLKEEERVICDERLVAIAKLVVEHNNELSMLQSNQKKNKNASEARHIQTKGKLLHELRSFYMQMIVFIDLHDMLRPKKDDPRFAAMG